MVTIFKYMLVMAICIFVISCANDDTERMRELNLEQKIGELQEEIQALAIKLETNPETEEAEKWKETHRERVNQLEGLMAEARGDSKKEEFSEIERTIGAIQEYKAALEQFPDHENAEAWEEALQEQEMKLKRLEEGKKLESPGREAKIKNIQEQIKELQGALARNPDADKAGEWENALQEKEQELEQLQEGEEIDRPTSEEVEFPELEQAIRRNAEQLREMEVYLKELNEKDSETEQMDELRKRLRNKRAELEELKTLLENRKKGEYQPSVYQREKGEVNGHVISATEMLELSAKKS